MAELFQFDESKQQKPLCLACEEMLADALDGTLGEADQAWFDRHIASCGSCSERMADAQRGAAWLEMLKSPRPEPSAQLMARILAQTSGAAVTDGSVRDGAGTDLSFRVPAYVDEAPTAARRATILPFGRFGAWASPLLQPRLAMTAAMAFFSVALTLNLTGVRLDELKASDLSPSHLRHAYYATNAQAVRYYDNLRVVRVMEARVDDLRETAADGKLDAPPAGDTTK